MNTNARRWFAAGMLLTLLLSTMGACSENRAKANPVQQKGFHNIATASANTRAIGEHLQSTGRVPEGKGAVAQADIVDNALGNMGFKPEAPVVPTVTKAEWTAAMDRAGAAEALAARLAAEKTKLTGELDAINRENNSWWAWLKASAGVAGALGAVAAVARALNVPGSGLIDLGVRTVFRKGFAKLEGRVEELATENKVAVAAVVGSDVGREGLAYLDARLAQMNPQARAALLAAMGGVLGKPVPSLDGYFKEFARGAAVDEGLGREVNDFLHDLRDDRESIGGRSESFAKVLQGLSLGVQAVGHMSGVARV